MNAAGQAFGPSLRAHRERRGMPLQAIAESTKIKASLLAALERNDVSHWPGGIYRRAFLRAYADAIGLAPEPVLAEFLRLFPDDDAGGVRRPSGTPEPNGALRLTLEPDTSRRLRAAAIRIASAAVDTSGVLLAGFVASTLGGVDPWTASGLIGLVYYPVASACLGQTVAAWCFHPSAMSHVRRRRDEGIPATAAGWRGIAPWLLARSENGSGGHSEDERSAAQELRAASH